MARDLRLLVRERIAAGDSDAQVIDFLVARYGEFVLLKPRLTPHTLLLWLLPPPALAGGGGGVGGGGGGAHRAPLETRRDRRSGLGQTDPGRRSAAGTADRRGTAGQAGIRV